MAIGRPITLTANVASKTISITATAGQTLFQPSGGYRINQLAVYRNGTRLVDGQDFTARDGASVTLLSGAVLNDILEFQIFDSFNVANAIDTNSSTQTIDGALIVSGGITGATIGIQSGGTAIGAGKTINFIGTGNTVVDKGDGSIDVSISGGGGGASKVYDSTIFAYQNIVQSDITIESPYLTGTIYASEDVTVDIEDGVTVTVDDGAVLNIIDI